MKKILVTGCNGQLGRAINKEYEKDDVERSEEHTSELQSQR